MRLIDMHESQLYWRKSAVSWQRLVEGCANGREYIKALVRAQEQVEFWEEQIQEQLARSKQ